MKTITIEFPQGKHLEGMIDVVSDDFSLHFSDWVTHDGLQCNYLEGDKEYYRIYLLCKTIAMAAREIVKLHSDKNVQVSDTTEDASSNAAK